MFAVYNVNLFYSAGVLLIGGAMKSLASDGEREVNKMPRYRVGRFPSLKGLT